MKSVLIIGLGIFGREMAVKLMEENCEVLAVEKDEARADSAVSVINDIQIGDASNEGFIRSLGVRNFDFCVVAIGNDFQTALEVTVLLKDLGAKYVIARAQKEVHRKLLQRNGADYVVFSEKDLAGRLAIRFGVDNLFDYIGLSEHIGIYEIALPSHWAGKTIIDLSIRRKYNVSVLAIKSKGSFIANPNPDYRFEKDDIILIMAEEDAAHKLLH